MKNTEVKMQNTEMKKIISMENRKKRKPLMERKRRARINDSLETLKTILLESKTVVPESSKTAKLEKADILELTVQYLQRLKSQLVQEVHQQPAVSRVRTIKSKDVKVRPADSSCDTIKYQIALVPSNIDNSKTITFVVPSSTVHQSPKLHSNRCSDNGMVWRPW